VYYSVEEVSRNETNIYKSHSTERLIETCELEKALNKKTTHYPKKLRVQNSNVNTSYLLGQTLTTKTRFQVNKR